MRGNERRITAEGRRTVDRRRNAPPWLSVALLAVTLALAACLMLFTREITRPGREAEVLRLEAVDREARLLALDIESRLAPVEAALRAAGAGQGAPAVFVQRARATAPNTPFAVLDSTGRVVAVGGAEPSDFAPAPGRPQLSRDGEALLVSRALTGDARLTGRVALPRLIARNDVSVAVLSDSRTPLTGASSQIAALRLGASPVQPDGRGVTLREDGRALRRSGAAIGDTGLIAVAWSPVTVGADALMDDVWVLTAPVGIGAFVVLIALLLQRRQQGITQVWAASEQRFRGAVEAARCGVWEWDTETDLVTVSDYMAQLMGLEQRGAVSSDELMERVHPRYRDAVLHALRQAQTFGAFDVSFPVTDSRGKARWIDARGQARGDRGEDGFTNVLGVALDTTEARRAKAQAQAAESRLRDGIESVSDAFVLFDKGGRLILSNQAFQDAFDFEEGVLRRGAFKQDLNRIAALAIKSDQPATGGRAGAREVELHDGRWLQLVERFTSDGGSVVTAADISAIKHKEA
ncbi:MAG TPA: PAS domain-containing protein, partial [Brevundimonas sp.]|nr:PAS domain-containing protein [Brevundimonas sp.]